MSWPTIGNTISYTASLEEQLAETRKRTRLVDRYCAEIGHDPASLRRSYLILDAGRYYSSTQIFADTMRRFIELGISEIGVGYPQANQLSVFEAIARETIPRLKEEYVLVERFQNINTLRLIFTSGQDLVLRGLGDRGGSW